MQGLPSPQGVPFEAAVCRQMPAVQESVVQELPSLQSAVVAQAWQFAIGVWTQPLAWLQESVVQALLSLQLSAVPAAQAPL